MDDKDLLKKRLTELADRSYSKGQFTFTNFLGISELSDFYEIKRTLEHASPSVYGGCDNAERAVVRFGNPLEMGYEEDFPIEVLKVSPLAEKFSDDLGHRDFLGALMNLGIERNLIGDIMISGNSAYIFCINRIADFIIENLSSVKHTTVSVKRAEDKEWENTEAGELKEKVIQVASERCDAVISKVYNLSRSAAAEYFKQKKVFINGRLTENTSHELKPSDVVTVRGFGRFIVDEILGMSRKGKLNIRCKY